MQIRVEIIDGNGKVKEHRGSQRMKVKVHLTNRRLNYGGGKAARVSLRIYIQKSDHKSKKKKYLNGAL